MVHTGVRVRRVGDLQSELVTDFFEGFALGARANVHVKVLYGRSSHHRIEASFKAFGRALRTACARDRRLAGHRLDPQLGGNQGVNEGELVINLIIGVGVEDCSYLFPGRYKFFNANRLINLRKILSHSA